VGHEQASTPGASSPQTPNPPTHVALPMHAQLGLPPQLGGTATQ
jgi:hypothetical protein